MGLPEGFTAEGLVERAIRNARARCKGDFPRWVAVRDTFATGSSVAIDLCKYYDLDPHEILSGI